MVENDCHAKAHQLIGAYFCAFSELERELGEAIKVVLRLEGNVAADAIVDIMHDFGRKARLVAEAVQGAQLKDGSEPTDDWKARTGKTIKEILGCNNPDRVGLAHDYLEPHADGSVGLQKPGGNPQVWTNTDFDHKIKQLKDLTVALRTVRTELTTLNIPVPTGGWMSVDAFVVQSPL